MEMWNIVRGVNLLFALVALGGCAVAARRVWPLFHMLGRRGTQLRLYGMGLFGLLFATLYGTIESFVLGIPGGSRVLLLSVPLFWLAAAGWAMFWYGVADYVRGRPLEGRMPRPLARHLERVRSRS